ncbi:hypothetical protein L7F22_023184 [Adiantum nelumboides]|nr:hypothetical protein [Adiantum nelumboides]
MYKVRYLAVHAHVTSVTRHLTGFLDDYIVATLTTCCMTDKILIKSSQTQCGKEDEALHLHQHLQREGFKPSARKFITLLRACGSIPDLAQGRKLHVEARKHGFLSDIYVGNTLLNMYGKCGTVSEAEDVFCTLPERTIVSWNVMLSIYAHDGQREKVLQACRQMQIDGPTPDVRTFVIIFQACGALSKMQETWLSDKQQASFEIGQAFHSLVLKKGLLRNPLIGNTLVSFYGKCGAVAEAATTFETLSIHSVVSWTSIFSTYVENHQGEMALLCYKRMQEEGFIPDKVACTIAFQACVSVAEEEDVTISNEGSIKIKAFEIGRALHADACHLGVASDTCVGTSIISMYGKCGAIVEAEEAFYMLPYHDIVSWNVLVSVYVEQGDREKAFSLYKQMQEQSQAVDEVTLIYVLQACSEHGSLEFCEELHFHMVCMGQGKLSSLVATVIRAYGNCGCLLSAEACFEEIFSPDLVSWSVLLSGYAGEGNDPLALQLFARLSMARILPDNGIFASILTACSHSGLIFEGIECFESMTRDYYTTPKLMHYGAITDLFGRAGEFKRVSDMLIRMPMQPDLPIWWFLLGACRTHSNLELAEQAFGYAVALQPKQATAYILMSYVYATAGLPDRVKEVEVLRQKHGLRWSELD